MKKIITLFLAIFAFVASYAQVRIYKTLADYKKDSAEVYNCTSVKYGMDPRGKGGIKPYITIKNEGKKEDIYLNEFWGFKYNGILFRAFPTKENFRVAFNSNMFVGLVSEGKICYWEAAPIIFREFEKRSFTPEIVLNHNVAYLSKTIESDIKQQDFRSFTNSNDDVKELADICYNEYMKEHTEKDLKLLNKIHPIKGVDDIAILNFYSMYTLTIYKLRNCINKFNGSINKQIRLKE